MNLVDATDEDQRAVARKALNMAVREHVKQLSSKNYQQLFDLASVDFVLMFIPIEGAFGEVVTSDQQLYLDALEEHCPRFTDDLVGNNAGRSRRFGAMTNKSDMPIKSPKRPVKCTINLCCTRLRLKTLVST